MSCAIRGQYTGKEPSRTPILILNEQGIDNTRSGECIFKRCLILHEFGEQVFSYDPSNVL